ncbi:MAG TPA: hypothetical protein VKW06_08835 [Candidatus Angelobacter sp.]|nr:hypothetical protein [Candidatus Angelobacter sp.]
MANYRKIVKLRQSIHTNLLLEVLHKFPWHQDEYLERRNVERQMLRVIDAICPDLPPQYLDFGLLGGRFVQGLNHNELECLASRGHLDGTLGRTLEDIRHFWEYRRWRNEWPLTFITVHEVEQTCMLLVQTRDKTDAEKEHFAVHGAWPQTSATRRTSR